MGIQEQREEYCQKISEEKTELLHHEGKRHQQTRVFNGVLDGPRRQQSIITWELFEGKMKATRDGCVGVLKSMTVHVDSIASHL